MTKPIIHFIEDVGIPAAFYIGGVLVAENISQNTFLWDFVDTRHDGSHIDPDTNMVVGTIKEADAIAKKNRIASYKKLLEYNTAQALYNQSKIDELEAS